MYIKAVKSNGHRGYSIPGQRQAYPLTWPTQLALLYLPKNRGYRDIIRDSGKIEEDKSKRTMLETKYYFVQER